MAFFKTGRLAGMSKISLSQSFPVGEIIFRFFIDFIFYKFNRVIAITETGRDTRFLEIRCLTGLFDIIFDTVGLCLSCDTASHGKGCRTVSSSSRCLAVYKILAM